MRGRAVLAGVATIGILALGGGTAFAFPADEYVPGDHAIAPGYTFRLNPYHLEPGAFAVSTPEQWFGHDGIGVKVSDHIDVTEEHGSLHVTVLPGANFSVDQVLVPGEHGGYKVYNTFDTGTTANDPDIDPGQTATDLVPPPGEPLCGIGDRERMRDAVIVAVSDHPDADQNEPYEQAANGEVAAINRPIITPFVAALGVSAVEPLNTYKIGFGYKIDQWYDQSWMKAFNTDRVLGFWRGDPQAFDFDRDFLFDHVYVKPRVEQPGVRRYNDITEAGEAFSDPHFAKADYGQTKMFFVKGDAKAFLLKSVPAMVDQFMDDMGVRHVYDEFMADETSPLGLISLTAQGDFPISWALKASLAPERYGRKVTFTDDQLRAWEASWQAYYTGKGPKPTLPLAPGTNSPAPTTSVIVNMPETTKVVTVPAEGGGTTQVVQQQAVKAVVATSSKIVKITLRKSLKSGRITYLSAKGLKTVKAKKSHGRLVAKADLRGLPKSAKKVAVTVKGKTKTGKSVVYTVVVRL